MLRNLLFLIVIFSNTYLLAQESINIYDVGNGWARNTVNTAVFRKNSLVSNDSLQFIAYYDENGYLILGKRKHNSSNWQLKNTNLKGNVKDAHNVISIMLDGKGYLHVAFDHHNSPLRYIKSLAPGSLEMTAELPMLSSLEKNITYPEFYKLANGDILFLYRDGGSGNGNLVMNRYDVEQNIWKRLHNNLIDGEAKRNAYWQTCVDQQGRMHISWVWRENPNVSSNHDMAYAYSDDGGLTWKKSTGQKYSLPITAATAEYAAKIPQKSELINQTSIATDDQGNPFIASYWRSRTEELPQYKIIYLNRKKWKVQSFDFRKTDFSLSGHGTKKIPISRPQLVINGKGKRAFVLLIFRDAERNNKVSVLKWANINSYKYRIEDIYSDSVASWEPTLDTEKWALNKVLSLYVQETIQVDGEGLKDVASTPVKVLDWKPEF